MRKIFSFIVVSASLVLISCSKAPLEGAVYVIKGSGDITRAASIDVHVLPFSTVQEFNNARSQVNTDAEVIALDVYQESQCASLPSKKAALLRTTEVMTKSFSPSCADETEEAELLRTKELMPASLNQKARNIERDRARLVETISQTMEKEAHDAISVRFDYESDEYGKVIVSNNSKYWATTGLGRYPASTAAFVDGILVKSCYRAKPTIAPRGSWDWSLGACVSSSESATLKNKGARVCGGTERYPALCMDDFGLEEYNSSVPGNYQKGEWVFAHRTVEETKLEPIISYTKVDFDDLALSDPRVKKLDEQVRRLKLQSDKSNQMLQNLNECNKINYQIADINKLTCPARGTTRVDFESFVKNARALGLSMQGIPARSDIDVKEFAKQRAVETVRTNVDGVFTVVSPPEGAFLLHATYKDNFNEVEWLVRVKEDMTAIELNNSNFR